MTPNPQRPTELEPALTAGEILALGDDHRQGLHALQAHPRCSACLLARLGATEAPAAGTRDESG